MSISQVQIIFLLIFGVCQRSFANPTTSSHPKELSATEKTSRRDSTPAVEEIFADLGPEVDSNCEPESDYTQQQIQLLMKTLGSNDSDVIIQTQKSLPDVTVLVLGETGSGKTSLVQFLTGNTKLQSKTVKPETGEYIIEDGDKIGSTATYSFTLYPEIINHNSTINFCDTPGFHGSRSSADEIISMTAMKKIISKSKKAKIVLLENYNSLQYGFSNSFINTLRHLCDLVVDIDRYKDHIALIATKLPLTFQSTTGGEVRTEIVTDEMHIESIMEYLKRTQKSLAEQLELRIISKHKKIFYQKAISLLKSLQNRDANSKSTRVNLFRRPNSSGPLENIALFEANKISLYKTINSLNSVEIRKHDFNLKLSDESNFFRKCLLNLTADNYKIVFNKAVYLADNTPLRSKSNNYTQEQNQSRELVSLRDELQELSRNLGETDYYNNLFEKLSTAHERAKLTRKRNEEIIIDDTEHFDRM